MRHQPDPTSEGKSYCIKTYTDLPDENTGIECTTDKECMQDPEFVGYCGTDKTTYEPILKPSNTDTSGTDWATFLSNFD